MRDGSRSCGRLSAEGMKKSTCTRNTRTRVFVRSTNGATDLRTERDSKKAAAAARRTRKGLRFCWRPCGAPVRAGGYFSPAASSRSFPLALGSALFARKRKLLVNLPFMSREMQFGSSPRIYPVPFGLAATRTLPLRPVGPSKQSAPSLPVPPPGGSFYKFNVRITIPHSTGPRDCSRTHYIVM